MRTAFIPLLAVLFIPLAALPQTQGVSSFRVEVHGGLPEDGNYSAELDDMSHHKVSSAGLWDRDSFEFRDVAPGQYWFSLTDGRGSSIYQELMTVGNNFSASIDLPRPKASAAPPSGPVSVAELQQKPSREAVRAFRESQKLSARHEYSKAAEELEKAIRVSPDFAAAHADLAVQYLFQRQFEPAIVEASRAMEITGPDPVNLCNLAYAQFSLRRFGDAARSARAALEIDPNSPRGHYFLGLVLALDRRTAAQAIPHLELAARTLPSARTNLEMLKRLLAGPSSP